MNKGLKKLAFFIIFIVNITVIIYNVEGNIKKKGGVIGEKF